MQDTFHHVPGYVALYSLPQDPYIDLHAVLRWEHDTGFIAYRDVIPAPDLTENGARFERYIYYPAYPAETQQLIMSEIRAIGQAREQDQSNGQTED